MVVTKTKTNNYRPSLAQIFSSEFCGNADMPFDFFMSRYKEAYVLETLVSAIGSVVRVRPFSIPCGQS